MFYKLLALIQLDSSEINPSPEVAASRHARGGFYILAVASLIVLVVSAINCFRLSAQENWIKSDASLQSAVIKERKEYLPELWIAYQYKVGGKSISATEIQRPNPAPSTGTRSWEKKYSSAMEDLQMVKTSVENKKHFSVYYNPASPVESRIARIDLGNLIVIYSALAGICVLIFIGSVWILCHPVKPYVPSIKEYGQLGDGNRTDKDSRYAENNRSIIGSLRDTASSQDNTAGDAVEEDGAVIDLKKREKETL